MKTVRYLLCVGTMVAMAFRVNNPEDDFCGIKNTTTQKGEEINYSVFYSVLGMYAPAGSATFINKLESFNGKMVYHIYGTGSSNSKYDWIYKVRDRYESYIDTATMQPLKFLRDVQEGRTKKYESIRFNRSVNTVITDSGVLKVPACIQDVLSTIYYARNIRFDNYEPNQKIPFRMFLENEVHDLYIRYSGKETIQTRYGIFKAIKFKSQLIAGTIFKGGEDMTVWVTDDKNRLPVRIESEILIGSIKVDMTGYKNLRYPLSSLQKKN